MENLVIVGIGTNSRLALSFIKYHNLFNVIGFAVNKDYYTCDTFEGYPVYSLEELENKIGSKDGYSLFISLLWNHLNADRRKLYDYCKNQGFKLANLISPLAIIRSEIKAQPTNPVECVQSLTQKHVAKRYMIGEKFLPLRHES